MTLGARQRWLLERWPVIRARGATRFVLVRGVLMWGGIMAAFLAVMVSMQLGLQHPRLPLLLALSLPLCAIGGAVWGALTWWINERIYRSLTSDTTLTP